MQLNISYMPSLTNDGCGMGYMVVVYNLEYYTICKKIYWKNICLCFVRSRCFEKWV